MTQLESEGVLFYTPSRNISGILITSYDDRYILKYALLNDSIIVSNDTYRDLAAESADFKRVVEERLLMYTFVKDEFMPPDDPFAQYGPSLDIFLSKPHCDLNKYKQLCPYDKKCTFGNKCQYLHPERIAPQKSVVESINENAKQNFKDYKLSQSSSSSSSASMFKSNKLRLLKSLPLNLSTTVEQQSTSKQLSKKKALCRTKSNFITDTNSETDISAQIAASSTNNIKVNNTATVNLAKQKGHRKLERQLTLYPEADPRLNTLMPNNSGIKSNSSFNISFSNNDLNSANNQHQMSKRSLFQTKSWNNSLSTDSTSNRSRACLINLTPSHLVSSQANNSKNLITKSLSVTMPVTEFSSLKPNETNIQSHSACITPMRKNSDRLAANKNKKQKYKCLNGKGGKHIQPTAHTNNNLFVMDPSMSNLSQFVSKSDNELSIDGKPFQRNMFSNDGLFGAHQSTGSPLLPTPQTLMGKNNGYHQALQASKSLVGNTKMRFTGNLSI